MNKQWDKWAFMTNEQLRAEIAAAKRLNEELAQALERSERWRNGWRMYSRAARRAGLTLVAHIKQLEKRSASTFARAWKQSAKDARAVGHLLEGENMELQVRVSLLSRLLDRAKAQGFDVKGELMRIVQEQGVSL